MTVDGLQEIQTVFGDSSKGSHNLITFKYCYTKQRNTVDRLQEIQTVLVPIILAILAGEVTIWLLSARQIAVNDSIAFNQENINQTSVLNKGTSNQTIARLLVFVKHYFLRNGRPRDLGGLRLHRISSSWSPSSGSSSRSSPPPRWRRRQEECLFRIPMFVCLTRWKPASLLQLLILLPALLLLLLPILLILLLLSQILLIQILLLLILLLYFF